MSYHHLSEEERDRFALLRSEGKSLRSISQQLGRSHSTLVRELKRNRHKPSWGPRVYYPHTAQHKAEQRLRGSHRRPRLKSAELHQEVTQLLEKRWSPELIAGRLKRTRADLPSLSPETIYPWIYQRRPDLVAYLARAHPRRRRRWAALKHRIRIPRRTSIRERPDVVQARQEPGHWESDLIVGPGPSALEVLVERQTRYTQLNPCPIRELAQ